MKTTSNPNPSTTAFPAVFNKIQSGKLFNTNNLITSLNPESESNQIEYKNIINSISIFQTFLLEYYKYINFNSSLTFAASQQIEYLFSLLYCVSHKGGWSIMNGNNYWPLISKYFNSLQAWKLRQDYDKYLFAFEKTWNPSSKFDDDTNDKFLTGINPSLMKTVDFYRPSLLANEITSVLIHSFYDEDCIVIPEMANKFLKINIEEFSIDRLRTMTMPLQYSDKSFTLDKLLCMNSFYTEFPLKEKLPLYYEISEKLLESIHWNSSTNLLRYIPETPGLSSPLIIILKNSFFLIGGQSYTSLNGVYITLYGKCEWIGIPQAALKALVKKVRKDQGVDLYDGSWRPDEKYLLINNIEFFYTLTRSGDIFMAKSDIVYWMYSELGVICQWFMLPKNRMSQISDSYYKTKDKQHKVNFPLLAVEYMNMHLPDVDMEIFALLKKIFVESIDEGYWQGIFIKETDDIRTCSLCGKDLVWRYFRCNKCRIQKDVEGFCLSCKNSHKCSEIENVEKFSSVELEKLYMRLDKSNESHQAQYALKKVLIREPHKGCGDKILLDTTFCYVEEKFDLPKNEKQIQWGMNSPCKKKTNNVSYLDVDECYKRKGMKKQKIREAMLNPLSGPRFNYVVDMKKKEQEADLAIVEIPRSKRKTNNPLSSLVKKTNNPELSALISIDRKKELHMKNNIENKNVEER
ncbi:hypothetical protein SteCoe_10665 [Stentor coeruleus]|uniref:ARID domain-containing protein n=1 Tax=Stentor coeruleus TaxID=5963 RepID=A0A1R2CEX4_9CILI|nr:hypothetical protein SteCoe_10665 [Stentor coeruleus]